MGRNSKRNQKVNPQPTWTRRALLGSAAAALAGGLIYKFGQKDFDLDFLNAPASPIHNNVIYLSDPEPTDMPPSPMLESAVRQAATNDSVKDRWYALGGDTHVDLQLTGVTAQKGAIPESSQTIAQSYARFVKFAMAYAVDFCDIPQVLPQVQVLSRRPTEDNLALIVNKLVNSYEVGFALLDKKGHRLPLTVKAIEVDSAQAICDFRLEGVVGGEVEGFKQTNIVLSTSHDPSSVFEGPIAEILHRSLRPGTQILLSDSLSGYRGKSYSDFFQRGFQQACRYEEALAHAAGHIVLRDLADKHNLPYSRADQETRQNHQATLQTYQLLRQGIRVLDSQGLGVLKQYLANPQSVVRMIDSG